MPTTPGGAPYPSLSDAPNGPGAIQALAVWLDSRVLLRFDDATARDAAITAPVIGMRAWLTSGGLTQYNGSSWQSLAPIVQNADTQITSTSTDWSETSPGGGWTAPASGRVRVRIGALMGNNGTSTTRMGFKIYRNSSASGTVAVDVSNTQLLAHKGQANDAASHERSFIVSGLTPGTTYYSIACYSVTGGTGSWQHRTLTIEPLD